MALADSQLFKGDDTTLQPDKKPVNKTRYSPQTQRTAGRGPLACTASSFEHRSSWAAAVGPDDSPGLHAQDTIRAAPRSLANS